MFYYGSLFLIENMKFDMRARVRIYQALMTVSLTTSWPYFWTEKQIKYENFTASV